MKTLFQRPALIVAFITVIGALLVAAISPAHADNSSRRSKPEILLGDYNCDSLSITVYSVSHRSKKSVRPISSVKVYLADGTIKRTTFKERKYKRNRGKYDFTVSQNDYPAAVAGVRVDFRGRRESRYAEIDFPQQCGNGGNDPKDAGCIIDDIMVETLASQQECDALITTYVTAGGGSDRGNQWSKDLWTTPTDPCNWEGVSCGPEGVTGLDLSYAFFDPSEIPIELYNLVKLTSLRLITSEIVGAIAPEIAQLTELVELRLNGNSFEALPPEIGKLSKLEYLDFTGAYLWDGGEEIPDEWAGLDSLKELSFNYVPVGDNDATAFFAGVIDTLERLSVYDILCLAVTDPELDAQLTLLSDSWAESRCQ